MFLRISTSSVCSAALERRFRIFIIFTIASCQEGGGNVEMGRKREWKGEKGERGEGVEGGEGREERE